MNTTAREAIARIGIDAPDWKTLVVVGEAETELPAEALWATWADLERWPDMTPLIDHAKWTAGNPWAVGSEFVQELKLGFPVGSQTSEEKIGFVDSNRSAWWSKEESGITSNHTWSFEPMQGGGTRITNVEAFRGLLIGLAKPLVAKRWQRLFQAHVDGLIATTIAKT